MDEVNSVTLKAFRKIVGYDTFESIRKKNRSEAKDTSDYYNVTLCALIRRKPIEGEHPAQGNATVLAHKLDKGFPYDD